MTCVKGTVSWGRAFQPVGSVLPPSTPRQNATGLWDTQWVPRRLVSELPLTLEKTFRRGRVSAQQTVPPAWDPSDTLIRPKYRLGLHAARGWRTKSVACAATSFASPDTPRHPHCASCPRFAEEPAEACRGAGADSLQFLQHILGFLPLVVPEGGTHGVLGGGAERVGWPGRQQGVRCLKM